MNVRSVVELTDEERVELRALVSGGSKPVLKVKCAQILLASDDDARDGDIATSVVVGTSPGYRTKQRFVEGGLTKALHDEPREVVRPEGGCRVRRTDGVRLRESTTKTGEMVPPPSSSSSMRIAPGATSRSPTTAPASTSPSAGATWWTCITPPPRAFASCSTASRPTVPARCTKRSRPPKRAASCAAWSWHYVPKHASWLKLVELELGVLQGQCLARRIDTRATLDRKIAAWTAAGDRIDGMFTVERVREKLGRASAKCTTEGTDVAA